MFPTNATLVAVGLSLPMASAFAQVPNEVQLPGSQPTQITTLEAVANCTVCHAEYDSGVEPWHNWQGSMMSHALRDPVFWAALTIAEQDYSGSGDACLRCHTPGGWLEGRSSPTDGSALQAVDADSVSCSFCHRLTNPDGSEHPGVQTAPFIANDGGVPAKGHHGGGEYVLANTLDKFGPYNNAFAFHPTAQSQFHRDSALCGTCHDVSNPVVGDLAPNNGALTPLAPGSFSGTPGAPLGTQAGFKNQPYAFGVIERTFSEHQSSAFSSLQVSNMASLPTELQNGSILTAFQSAQLSTVTGDYVDGSARTFSCQSCHMRPVQGYANKFQFDPLRQDLPLHDLTGGNYWVPEAIKYLDAQNKLVIGGGLTAIQVAAIDAGTDRARFNLEDAAALSMDGNDLRVVNLTGHKLITGYPEGRRMWLNMKWYDFLGNLLREDGEYGDLSVQIGGQPATVRTILDLDGTNTKIYELHLGVSQEWATKLLTVGSPPSLPLSYDRVTGQVVQTLGGLAALAPGSVHQNLHVVLDNTIMSDNRIPPYGMDYDEAVLRNAQPWPDSQYGNPGPGGSYDYFDTLNLNPPSGAHHADIQLLYQPTSWEYIQFLSLANDGTHPTLGSTGTDILDAWLNTGMAEPHLMAETTWVDPNSPVLSEAQPESTYQLVLDLHIVPGQNAAFEALELARNTRLEAAGVTFPARMALQEGLPAVYRKTHFGLANQAALDTRQAQLDAARPLLEPGAARGVIDDITSSVRRTRPELSYVPENPRVPIGEATFIRGIDIYLPVQRGGDAAAIIEQVRALYEQHDIRNTFFVTSSVTGSGPDLRISVPARDAADFYTEDQRVRALLGEELLALLGEMATISQRVEYANLTIRRDLRYQPGN